MGILKPELLGGSG